MSNKKTIAAQIKFIQTEINWREREIESKKKYIANQKELWKDYAKANRGEKKKAQQYINQITESVKPEIKVLHQELDIYQAIYESLIKLKNGKKGWYGSFGKKDQLHFKTRKSKK